MNSDEFVFRVEGLGPHRTFEYLTRLGLFRRLLRNMVYSDIHCDGNHGVPRGLKVALLLTVLNNNSLRLRLKSSHYSDSPEELQFVFVEKGSEDYENNKTFQVYSVIKWGIQGIKDAYLVQTSPDQPPFKSCFGVPR